MRDIKFRAWDTQRHEFLSGGEIFIAIQPGKHPRNIIYLDIIKDPDMYKNRFDIQQYTGLKDKNGKEIYEGDILWNDREKSIYEVMWLKEECRFGLRFKFRKNYQGDTWIETREDIPFNRIPNCEITGNIYENPELLEVE
jgi:uncharacterized phage protein (TIGR01671 family)